MSDEMKKEEKEEKKEGTSYNYMALGISLGMLLGISFGTLYDKLALGISVGTSFGISLGLIFNSKNSKGDKEESQKNDKE